MSGCPVQVAYSRGSRRNPPIFLHTSANTNLTTATSQVRKAQMPILRNPLQSKIRSGATIHHRESQVSGWSIRYPSLVHPAHTETQYTVDHLQ
jgi:hypothetical protein